MTDEDARLANHLQLQELQGGTSQEQQDARLAMRLQAREETNHQRWRQRQLQRRQEREIAAAARPIIDDPGAPGCCEKATPLQIKHRASQVNSALAWHCVVEALVSALLVPMFMMISRLFFALALCCCIVAPALGLAAARWSKWWLALPHCIAAAGVIALRSYVPLQTVNWLVVSSAVVAALSALHQLNLGFRWLVFTVRHGKMLQRKKREEDGDTAREENRRRDNSTRGREEEDVPMGVPLDDGSPVSAAPGVPPQPAQRQQQQQQRSGGIGVNTMAEITSL